MTMAAAPARLAVGAGRLHSYLGEMFPPVPRLVAASLLHAGFATILARIHGTSSSLVSAWAALGAGAAFASMLILRLMDELKDVDVDRALFPARPLPSGRVHPRDIVAGLLLVVVLFVGVHALTPTLPTALAVLAYGLLMFRWFFVPRIMRPRLLLALATHQPFVPLVLVHLAAVFAAQHGLALAELRWATLWPAIVLYWSGFLGWEIARKIRAPEEEDAYVTYSRLFGARGAVAMAAGAQAAGVAAGLWLWSACGLSPATPGVLLSGFSIALVGYSRFLLRPRDRRSCLRPWAEAYCVATCVAGIVA